MLPSAQARLIFCWCRVPSCDHVVRRHLFFTRKYWWPNTIFHLGKSFNIFSNWFLLCFRFSNFVDLWIPIIGTQKDEEFIAFCFHDFHPSDMLLDQCEKCPPPHTHTHTHKSQNPFHTKYFNNTI